MGNFVIGIDGGGTGSKGVVADLNGNVLMSFKGGAMNYVGGEKEVVDRNISTLFSLALSGRRISDCAAICIGCAGISDPVAKANIETIIKKAGFSCPYIITTDSHTAHAGALNGKEGAILIAGTGSICQARKKNGENLRTGGYGYLIDDEGSGYDIGRQILRAVVRAEDGRGPKTILKDMVYDKLNIDSPAGIVSWLYSKDRTKKDTAGLAVMVEAARNAGDEVAIEIEKNAARELAILCKPAIEFFGGDITIALSGSVLQKNERIRDLLKEQLKEEYPDNFGNDKGVRVISAVYEADRGAMLIALDMLK